MNAPIISISVYDVVKTSTPLSFEKGVWLYEKIVASLEQADEVHVDFTGIEKTTSGVMNNSIGRIYLELGTIAAQKVKITGCAPDSYLSKMISISIQLAELGQAHHNRLIESISEIPE